MVNHYRLIDKNAIQITFAPRQLKGTISKWASFGNNRVKLKK
jgi:hypothetical protein